METNEARATWDELDEIQQYILRDAATLADTVSGHDLATRTAISGLYLIGLLEQASGVECYTITAKGRAVFAAGNAPDVEGFDPYDYSVLTASELLDTVRKTWRDGEIKYAVESTNDKDDFVAATIIDLALSATPAPDAQADTLAKAEGRVSELEAANEAQRNALEKAWAFIKPLSGDSEFRTLIRDYSQHDEFWESWGIAYTYAWDELERGGE